MAKPSEPTISLTLTEDQKKQIEQLAPKMREGGSLEVARTVFNDPSIKQLSAQWRVVHAYIKEVYPEAINTSEEPVDEKQYQPPATLQALCGLVNRFVQQSDNRKTYGWGNDMKPHERRCLEGLMMYVRVFRFAYAASQFERQVDRDLFLSTFIRWTHAKPDLTEIEVDQMISAAEETVNIAQIGRSIQRIEKLYEEIAAGEVFNEEGKKVKLTQNDVELVNNIRTKHDTAKKRLESLMDTLETARSERLKKREDKYTSILDILNPWTKSKDYRDSWLKLGQEEKDEDAAEVERLSNADEFMALMSGQTKDEARS